MYDNMTKDEQTQLRKLMWKAYGPSIVVFKPKDLDYYIMSSNHNPATVKKILLELLTRL